MGLKRKDFQKAAAFLKEFLLKLSEDIECAELRDTLMLALLHMQKYYRLLQCRTQERTSQHQLSLSARGLSPMTPFVDAPDKFQWKWVSLDSAKYLNSSTQQDEGFYHVPDIILATREGNLEWVSKLIHEDPSLCDATDSLGRSSLLYAIQYNHLDVLEYLLDNGADPNVVTHDGTSPIHKACHDGNYIALQHLIDHGGDIYAQDNQLRSPVHWAVTTPQLKCLQNLLQNKADVSARDKDGLTPCMWACRVDHIMHFEMLYNVYKQLSNNREYETDDSGRTWIHWAVRRTEPLKCLQYLLSRDSAALKDGGGKTVILVAAELGSFPACKLIFDLVGPHVVHDCDNMDRTALHLATIRGHGTVLNFLLENGADLEARDRFQATAWDYAKNKQLHYCQLIMMSHKRQFLQSSPRDTCLTGNSTGTNANLEPWMGNTPDSTPRRIPYSLVSTDRSNNDDVTSRNNNDDVTSRNNSDDVTSRNKNDDVTSRNNSDRNEANSIQSHHNNNSNTNNNNYYSIKTNTNSDKNNYIPDPKSTFIKINPQSLQVSNKEIPAYNNVHSQANVVKPMKDPISSPCPPKKSRTVSRLARVSFQHRSLSESFEQHPSNTQTVDYAIMETRQMPKSDDTESRSGVYGRQNTSDIHYTSIDRQDCAVTDDSNGDIEVISDEMNVSNIEEHDQHPSLVAATGNFSDAHQISDTPPFSYPSQNALTTPTLEEAPSRPELSNQEGPETCSHVGFPYPRPPSSPILSSPNGSNSPGILLNRRNLLSQNQLKSQPLLKQPMKSRSVAKMLVPRLVRNPSKVNKSEATQTGKVLKSSSFGSDTSKEHKENSGVLSWQGLAPVLMNMSASFIAPVNPILPQQEEPLPKFLLKESMPLSGPNPGVGTTNFSNNARPTSDQRTHSDFSSGNFKSTEISDWSVSAASSKPGIKGMMDTQGGAMIQQHLSPSSSTSSLSMAGQNKSGNSNMFYSSSQTSELSIGGQKSDVRRLPSALIPLVSAASLAQNQQQIVQKKKKKRKKSESEEFPFKNTVIKGKSLQNLSLHHQLGVKPLAAMELPVFTVESKTDHPNQGMESPLPLNPILNSPKKPESRSKDCSFGTSNKLYPTVISSSKGRGRVGGFQITSSSIQQNTQNRSLQKEVNDNQHAAQKEGDLNDLTTVGTGLFGKRATANHIASTVNNSKESSQDLISEKLHPVPTSKEKWSLPENGLLASSKKQLQSTSPINLVEPDLVKSKPPLPYAKKSLLH